MASAFSHIAVPIAMRVASGEKVISRRLLFCAMILSAAPDLDSIAFKFGIPYESQWGHRGFTHSLFFALIFAVVPTIFHRSLKASKMAAYFTCFISMVSHGILDACTTGGLGVAFLWPLDSQRYFFPWQVIEVSPINPSRFFTQKGLLVLSSELFYIWAPCLVFGIAALSLRKGISFVLGNVLRKK